MQRIFWSVWGRDQGQAVTLYRPQVAGAAEGAEGDADGLRLTHDGSSRMWRLTFRGREIAEGSEAIPDVDKALRLKRLSLGVARSAQP